MAFRHPADFRFGDVLRLIRPATDYEMIRIVYIGEAGESRESEPKRIIAAAYLVDNGQYGPGHTSTFYAHSYEVADD